MKSTLLVISLLATIFSWAQEFNGYALYNRSNQSTAYLIDKDGGTAHTWSCTRPCNYTVLLKEDGNIVRGAVYSSNELSGAAIGGLVQEYDPSGDVVWEYVNPRGKASNIRIIGAKGATKLDDKGRSYLEVPYFRNGVRDFRKYGPDYPGFLGRVLVPGTEIPARSGAEDA